MPGEQESERGGNGVAPLTLSPPFKLSFGGLEDRERCASLIEAVTRAVEVTRENTNAVLIRDSGPGGKIVALHVRLQEA